MVMLTLKQFQYFIKIVEEGSFTAASEKLFIAQSALSRQIKLLEEEIDEMDELLPKMTHFILPGGHTTVSYCHIARNVCRRAERISVQLAEKSEVSEFVLGYLNRLSDYLFVLARKLSKDLQAKEVLWLP